jgi:hypothetical protein
MMTTTNNGPTEKQKWAAIVEKIQAMDLTPDEKVKVTDLASGYFQSHRAEPSLAGIAAHIKKAVLPPSIQQ